MRSLLLMLSLAFVSLISLSGSLYAQINTGLNGMVITLPCNQNCVNQPFRIPHLKTTSDYAVTPVAYLPYPYVTTGGTEDPNIYNDDRYSLMFDLPFPFCFFDSIFTKVSVGSNGIITFDYGLLNCPLTTLNAAWDITSIIPFNSNQGSCNGNANNYPKASIMGDFQDLDPRPGPTSPTINSSPPDRKIEWRVEGTAPFRRFVVSYYKIGVYQQTVCGLTTPATFQIVIYESTGVIDIFIENKICSSTGSANGGKAILGIQNWNRDKGLAAPGKNAVPWTASNEGYRFVPSGPVSRFVRCELQTLGGTLIALGDTLTTTPGLLDVTFQNFCQTAATGQYVIKSIFSACDNPSEIASLDTITVNKTNALNATGTSTQTVCGVSGTGTVTITVPAGLGTAPFTYVLTPGNFSQTGNDTSIFANLTAGSYTVNVADAGGCSSIVPVTVTSNGQLNATFTSINPSCPGAFNGSITVNVPNGTPPVQFSINGGPLSTNNTNSYTFYGLSASAPPIGSTYFFIVQDAGGCQGTYGYTIYAGTSTVTGTATPSPTTCAGVNDGKITLTPTSGSGPYQYSINNGITWQTSNIFSGLAPGSYNILIKEAGACTSAPIPATITAGNGLQGGITPSPTTCTGANNGSISVTMNAGSGTAPFTFVLDGTVTQTSATNTTTFINVSSGPHSVTVIDANGCITSVPLTTTVTAGTGFTATFAPTPTGCAGASNGKLVITASAQGTPSFTVVLSPGAITQTSPTLIITFNNLAAGTYSAVIRDANGCQFNLNNMIVAAGAGLLVTPAPVATTCSGANNGSISVTSSGTAPLTFVLDGTITQTTATNTTLFNNLSAGPHNITATDANGCITTTPVTTTVPTGTGFTASVTPIPTGCAGVNNGSLAITPLAPATGPFTIVLNPGAITLTGAGPVISFNNLAAGTYSAVVRDANGCQLNLSNMNVAVGAGLIATPTPSGTSCPGVNNGSISINMGSGAAPYTAVMDGTITQTSAANIISFASVSAGPHTITVTDANGCITETPVTTTVPAGIGFTVTFNPTPTGCAGASNGKLVLTSLSPGTAPFTAVLNPGAITQTSPTTTITFNNLAAGTYSAVITDANGCQFTLNNMNVAAGSALNAMPTPVGTTCNGASNGIINITPVTNGTAPYLYSLNGGTPQAIPSFNSLAAATYTINVTDNGGCSSGNISVTVNAGPSISVTPNKSDATCFGSSTGSITAIPSGNATAPIQYSLDNVTWQASPDFASLTANTYTVYIRDAVGCSNSASITVGQPLQLLAATFQQSVLCNSGNNGKIFVNAAGGTVPYSYSLDNITFQPGNIFNVAAGSYTVYVRDANGCTIPPITNVSVTEPALLTASPASTNATCDGGNDGTISITPTGGASPYQYAITGSAFQAANNFNVAPGTYDITVKDVNGCTYPVTGVVVDLTNNLTYTAMVDPAPICEGNSIPLQLITNATQFAWTNGGSLSNSNIANPTANPVDTTLYKVTATLGRCSITDDVVVTVIPAPIPDAGPPGDICYGQTYQLQGSGGTTYTWTPAIHLSSASIYNPVVSPDKTIIYTLSVTDANGCASLVTDQVTVKVTPPIRVTTYPADTVVYAGVQIPLLAISAGQKYAWTSVTGTLALDNSNIANPTATAPLTDGNVVIYKVTATTSANCQGEAFVKIQIYKGPDIYVVTAFTPNGDGKNETFIPFPVGIKKLNYFRVFNRWGQLLYSTTTLNKGWDGRLGGIEQEGGVYIWMVEGVTMDNKLITKKGTVTLIR